MREPFGLENHSDHEPVFSTDLVCGRQVDEDKAAAKIGFEGQMYYFVRKIAPAPSGRIRTVTPVANLYLPKVSLR